VLLATVLLVVGAALLALGGEMAVASAARLARLLGLPLFALGAVLFGIDLEGLGTAVFAAGQGHTAIASGEAFGTLLFVASFAFGVALLASREPVPSPRALMVLAPAVPIAAAGLSLYDGGVDRVEAVILLAAYAGYVGVVVADGRAVEERTSELEREAGLEPVAPDPGPDAPDDAEPTEPAPADDGTGPGPARGLRAGSTLARTVLGLGLLTAGAWALVAGGIRILDRTGLREGFVGVAIVAVLSGLDEVMLEVVPVRRGRPSLATGNLFGTIAAFPTAVLGIAALVRPLPADTTANLALIVGAALYALISAVFLLRGRAGRVLGAVLVLAFPAWLVAASQL
jgi:cation:H+ antiporter